MQDNWTPTSHTNHPNPQALAYENREALKTVIDALAQKPALVRVVDIHALKQALKHAAKGRAFILQGGDCAESFQACKAPVVQAQINLMYQLADILEHHARTPIIPLGRIAGQYAKPRSAAFETQDGHTLPSYRGDLINQTAFNTRARTPQPELLLKGYTYAQTPLGYIQKARHAHHPFYTSHEALHLPYEASLTRKHHDGLWYNTSTHLPWLGVRTNQLDGAQVEYLRGIQNPIGIKVGPRMTDDHLTALLQHLNPKREAGRILLITRLGAEHVQDLLPQFIHAVNKQQMPVTWSCDPMHGNTEITLNNIKTRAMHAIQFELQQTCLMHKAHQSHLGGVHLEMTAEPVTECLGGKSNLREEDLTKAYTSLLDPRLNPTQAIEIAENLALQLKHGTQGLSHVRRQAVHQDVPVAHPA